MNVEDYLSNIPLSLRSPLLEEYRSIIRNYLEHRWTPAELSGGKFCEIVFVILDGYAKGSYASSPTKPKDFVGACRALEQNAGAPRSFQILIPRILPAIYEVRNNRGVGHVGGDVDSNHMDASFVVASANWIMSELIRVYHNVPVKEAQGLVDRLVERRTPIIWESGNVRRVLNPSINIQEQILLLLDSSNGEVKTESLFSWIEYDNLAYLRRLLRSMHSNRLIELAKDESRVQILPPGSVRAAETVRKADKFR